MKSAYRINGPISEYLHSLKAVVQRQRREGLLPGPIQPFTGRQFG